MVRAVVAGRARRWLPCDLAGLAAATVFLCWSLTPSLLPRSWLLQGAVSGSIAAAGYGLGVLVGHLTRRTVRHRPAPRVRRAARGTLAVVAPLAAGEFLRLGAGWQRDLHLLAGVEQPPPFSYVGIATVTLALFGVLVLIGRGLRWIHRRVAAWLHRWVPRAVARMVSALLVALLVVGLLDGVVLRTLLTAARQVSAAVDRAVAEDLAPPRSTARSGGPGSLVAWEELGSKGREFVTSGPSVPDLRRFGGRPASTPVRVYVGLGAADGARERAALAIAELERTGGFERAVLCVIVPTGTGWVNAAAADALEYLHGGDTALVAMQYSNLPSWLAYVSETASARAAGRELFNQVYERWVRLPAGSRPLLLAFGQSLGSYGSEAAFSGVADLRNRIDGVLWVGPPNFNELWRELTARRDAGTPQRLPVVDRGRTVRFAARPPDLLHPDAPWPRPRVVYLQHSSDPVVWWSPELILRRPDWLREPRGPDVLDAVRWFPLVTFTQLTVDLLYDHASEAEPHGHQYGTTAAAAWAAIVPPDGWDPADTARLQRELRRRAASSAAARPAR